MLATTTEQLSCNEAVLFVPGHIGRFGCIVCHCILIGVLHFGVSNVRRKKNCLQLKNHHHTWDGNCQEGGGTPGSIWNELG